MRKSGIVIKTEKGIASVMFLRASGCGGNCKSCSSCEQQEHFVELENSVDAKVGDKVEVIASSGRVLKLTLLIYVVPLLFFLAGTIGGYLYFRDRSDYFELFSFLSGVVAFFASVLALRLIDRRYGKQNATRMEIARVIDAS